MASNATGARSDPVGGYNFLIALIDSSSILSAVLTGIQSMATGGFSECSGLMTSLAVEEYSEGGRNDTTRKFATRVSWSNITLKRGVTLADDLWNWYYDYVQGRGKRRDGIIVLQNELHAPLKVWQFTRGLPVRWSGPALNAAQSQIAIEELEIAHEGLTLFSIGAAIGAVT